MDDSDSTALQQLVRLVESRSDKHAHSSPVVPLVSLPIQQHKTIIQVCSGMDG